MYSALFNHLNKLLTIWRLNTVNKNRHIRFAEVLVVALVVAVFSITFPYIADDCRPVAIPETSQLPTPTDLDNRKACFTHDCKCEPEVRGAIIQQVTKKWSYDCINGSCYITFVYVKAMHHCRSSPQRLISTICVQEIPLFTSCFALVR